MFIRFIYCIRFRLLLCCVRMCACTMVWTYRIRTSQKPTIDNLKQIGPKIVVRNNADNSNGNTIDEHHLLLQFMRTFMQLGDKFVWAMASHGYRNGKSVYQSYSVDSKERKREKKNQAKPTDSCLFSCICFQTTYTQNLHEMYAKSRI